MAEEINEIQKFINRMKRLGIETTYASNVPWIYLDTVNGKKVKTKLDGKHGFTAFWAGVKAGDKIKVNNITELFKEIRKHID